MFNNLIATAQRAISNIPTTLKNQGGLVGGLLGGAGQIQHNNTGGGLVNNIIKAAQSYIQPPQPAAAQQPTPQPASPPRQLPQQPVFRPITTGATAMQPLSVPSAVPYTPYQGPSMEDAAKRFAEQRMQQYQALIAPKEQALQEYLASRQPYSQVYESQLAKYNIPQQQGILNSLASDIATQQSNLENIPKEDLARRVETGGMLSEAARRRIEEAQARPIREQLIKSLNAQGVAQQGYDRATQLAQQGTNAYAQETQQGITGFQSAIDSARQQFGVAADSVAQQLTGFSQDRSDALRQYEAAQQQGYQLSQIQAQQAAQLKKEELAYNQQAQVVGSLTQEVAKGSTLNSVMGKYLAQGLDPDTILSLYNAYSPYGGATEQPQQLGSLYGVSLKRFGEGSGSTLSNLINAGA